MLDHTVATREQWLAARLELLEAEKALTRRGDELAQWRRELPWVRVEKDYRLETDAGPASLADLFQGRSQLIVYHFMFGPEFAAGCPSCSAIADGFDGSVVHLANHDVTLCVVSRAPLGKLQDYKRRMGWSFPWVSSAGSDFNYDFEASYTREAQESGALQHNYATIDMRPTLALSEDSPWVARLARVSGVDWATYRREAAGVSCFTLHAGVVYHTYSAYARGIDGLWAMNQWLDRAPLGRNESGPWWRRHDEYDNGG
jgi:predicted dithiol-disulfide oxidoreductase (DUF899 family)